MSAYDCVYFQNRIFYSDALVMYHGTDYFGIKIPENVTVYFTNETLSSCSFKGLMFYSQEPVGLYSYNKKKIIIDDNQSINMKQMALRHDLSHYRYKNIIDEEEKDIWKYKYDLYCYSPNEFYAYMHQGGD